MIRFELPTDRIDYLQITLSPAFAPDGMRAAVGGTDRQIVVWDLDD
jgi:hypothetical protein